MNSSVANLAPPFAEPGNTGVRSIPIRTGAFPIVNSYPQEPSQATFRAETGFAKRFSRGRAANPVRRPPDPEEHPISKTNGPGRFARSRMDSIANARFGHN